MSGRWSNLLPCLIVQVGERKARSVPYDFSNCTTTQTSANGNCEDELEEAVMACPLRDCVRAFWLRPNVSGPRAGQSHAPGRHVRHYSRETVYRRTASANGARLAHLLEIFRRRRPPD